MTPRELVLKDYPNAECKLRPTGKKYYQVLSESDLLGQGKSKDNAWKAAYNNINA